MYSNGRRGRGRNGKLTNTKASRLVKQSGEGEDPQREPRGCQHGQGQVFATSNTFHSRLL